MKGDIPSETSISWGGIFSSALSSLWEIISQLLWERTWKPFCISNWVIDMIAWLRQKISFEFIHPVLFGMPSQMNCKPASYFSVNWTVRIQWAENNSFTRKPHAHRRHVQEGTALSSLSQCWVSGACSGVYIFIFMVSFSCSSYEERSSYEENPYIATSSYMERGYGLKHYK